MHCQNERTKAPYLLVETSFLWWRFFRCLGEWRFVNGIYFGDRVKRPLKTIEQSQPLQKYGIDQNTMQRINTMLLHSFEVVDKLRALKSISLSPWALWLIHRLGQNTFHTQFEM